MGESSAANRQELDRLASIVLGAGVDWEQAMAELDNDELDGDSAWALRWIKEHADA